MPEKTLTGAAEVAAVLSGTAILQGAAEATLRRIAAIAEPLEVDEGETLYAVGDPARSAYVVISGRLRFVIGGDGRPEASGSIALIQRVLTIAERCTRTKTAGSSVFSSVRSDSRARMRRPRAWMPA